MFLPTRRSIHVPLTIQVALHLMDPINRALDHRPLSRNADQRNIPYSIEILRELVCIDLERKQQNQVDLVFCNKNSSYI